MKKINSKKIDDSCTKRSGFTEKNDDATWPPPPTSRVEIPKENIRRPYLTNVAWLDIVLGLLFGMGFCALFVYALTNYVMYYLIPHRINLAWNIWISDAITALALALIWQSIRQRYPKLAGNMIFGSLPIFAIDLFFCQWLYYA